jgi:hypothetical protein
MDPEPAMRCIGCDAEEPMRCVAKEPRRVRHLVCRVRASSDALGACVVRCGGPARPDSKAAAVGLVVV